jgi:hypothetical protein
VTEEKGREEGRVGGEERREVVEKRMEKRVERRGDVMEKGGKGYKKQRREEETIDKKVEEG